LNNLISHTKIQGQNSMPSEMTCPKRTATDAKLSMS